MPLRRWKLILLSPLRDDIHQRRILRDIVHRTGAFGIGAAGGAGDENIEIAHGFAAAAQGTGGSDAVDAGKLRQILGELLRFGFGGVDEKAARDAAVVFDGLQQLLFVLLAHARQFANLAFARKFFYAIDIADLIGAPDQGNRLRSEALDLQQLEHRRVIFLEQFGLHRESAVFEQFLQVDQHAFADAGDGEHFLRFGDDVFDLLGVILDGLSGVAVGADAERILAVDFEQVGGFVEDVGDGFVVHGSG